ncbi:DivIVA domain-containing protein [Nocardiopsis sp. FIRDI 009]|nr:DivIVA domain-containing protein [Nocardiopsis sp. FIRDI 009]
MVSADPRPEFDVVLRGYARAQVDAYLQRLTDALAAAESRNGRG